MSEQRFVVQEDANTDKIILLIDYKRMKMYSFLAEEREAVNKICNYLNWFDECTDNYAVMLKEIEESNCEKSKEIAKLKREIGEQQSTINNLQELVAELGATLLMNGFEIEINGKDLNELIKDE